MNDPHLKLLLEKGLLSQELDTMAAPSHFSLRSIKNPKSWNPKVKIIVSVIFVIYIGTLISLTLYNNYRESVIYSNFLGKSFSGSDVDDSDFVSDYKNNNINPYKVYLRTTKTTTLSFTSSGTIDSTHSQEIVALSYPAGADWDYDSYNSYDKIFDSFQIYITLLGDVYLKINNTSYKLYVTSANVPTKIYDYSGIDLK